uniref:Glycoprotein-N-acetylgalactosamine 3-beta-galactosyltransferase 1 n=1 Tax=Noccaea caerulescens TaxID=107243 RepID=A0A1J3ISF1_NOCCA
MRLILTVMLSFIPYLYSSHRPCSSPVARPRIRRCRLTRFATALVATSALLLASVAWLSLVFSPATSRCWHLLKDWEDVHIWNRRYHHHPSSPYLPTEISPPSLPALPIFDHEDEILQPRNRSLWETDKLDLSLHHLMFGIAGSSQLWERRKDLVRLWWRPTQMRGHVWLEEQVSPEEGDDSLPPIIVSEDSSRFRYTNPTGHPSGLRISRIAMESFRLSLPDVRWFILGDDDTIFNVHNLLAVLSKYDPSEMVYIGNPSESHSANSYFSHNMGFGGGGIAISYPLAEALSRIHDDCLDRYPKLYGSDDRLHACITELGVPLSKEPGFHQWDIKGDAHGLLSSHPIAPFVSFHHVEAVNPLYPGLSTLDSLKLFTRAMSLDPKSVLQRSICYDHTHKLTFSISLGYVVQVFPNILLPRDLERAELTFSAWNGVRHPSEFDLDIKLPVSSLCKKPILFFLKEVGREGNATLGTYSRSLVKDDLKRKLLCFPRSPPLQKVEKIQVLGLPLSKNWHLAPRRLCCGATPTANEPLKFTVGLCGKIVPGSRVSSQ